MNGGDMRKGSVEIAVGVFVLVGLICVGYLAIRLGQLELMGGNYYALNARFASVSGLTRGAQVEMAGVEIGQVDDITLDPVTQAALVTLKILKTVEVSDDVIASVKTSGLIGDKYIKLSPGGSEDLLQSGAFITETESAVDIEELISKYVFKSVD
jgi:phospholipid/cholesterol/gamma-HCH transport system substrate-binding protein